MPRNYVATPLELPLGAPKAIERVIAKRTGLNAPLAVDFYLLFAALLLVGFGLVMIYSTTGVLSSEKYGDALFFLKRQGAAALVGLLAFVLALRCRLEFLRKISGWFYPVCLVLLALVFVPGLGHSSGGAKRWIVLSGLTVQPGEFVKLLFVIFMAGFFARKAGQLSSFTQGIIKPVLLVAGLGALFLLQPDFGSLAASVIVALALGTVCGVKLRYLALGAVGIAICLGLLIVVSPYRLNRVLIFLAPWQDVSGKGYQLIQSLIAVGTGRFWGVGLGDSAQKLFFLPAAHTDFIFAVIAEEFGFAGATATVLVYLFIFWRGLKLASRLAHDTFAYALAVGLTLLLVLPALLNVGVVIGLLPTKGMVLPLIGYGGSNLVASLLALGVLLSLGREVPGR